MASPADGVGPRRTQGVCGGRVHWDLLWRWGREGWSHEREHPQGTAPAPGQSSGSQSPGHGDRGQQHPQDDLSRQGGQCLAEPCPIRAPVPFPGSPVAVGGQRRGLISSPRIAGRLLCRETIMSGE